MMKAVIFDVDGTLVDSNELHVEAWDIAFKKFGFNFPIEQLRSQIGKGSDQYIPAFLTADQVKEFGKELDKYRSKLFQDDFLPRVQPFPEVRTLFRRVQADGKKIALASSGKGEEVEHYKKICRIENLVDCEITSDDADSSKPAPDVFEASLKKMKLEPAEAVAVGDTRFDAEAAGKTGIKAVGLVCGGMSAEVLREAGMIAVYRDPADLLAHYDASPLAR